VRFTKTIVLAAVCALLASGQAKSPKGGGIKVHGHWVLEIRNPNGSLAKRTEFENSLTQGSGQGNSLLAQVLSGSIVEGAWAVQLYGGQTGGTNNLVVVYLASTSAICTQLVTNPAVQSCGAGLQTSVSSDGTRFILQGTSAPFAGTTQIILVQTYVSPCGAGAMPGACVTPSSGLYTFTQAGTNTIVQQGQTAAVTVTISFT
jgi:hypothetical protein